jgi:hypothetical protein
LLFSSIFLRFYHRQTPYSIPYNKIKGIPFEAREIKNRIIELIDG